MRRALLLVAALPLAGCLTRAEVAPARYFRPGPPPAIGEAPAAPGPRSPLRLRDVTAADHLRERMVWSTAAHEVGFYEQARWTEPPAAYVEDALSRALFERGPFVRASGADAPVLDVHVLAFEEVTERPTDPAHQARVALHVLLTGPDGQALVERTIVGTAPLTGAEPEASAAAIGVAMDQAVRAAVEAVTAATR